MKTIIVGLTGGYATGKTEVAKMFKKNGAKVVSSDAIAHTVMLPGTDAWKRTVEYFGKEILLKNKRINRSKLASIVFADKNKLKQLNGSVHPAVKIEIKRIIKKNKNNKILIFEIPLLFESHMGGWFDKIITVIANKEIQYKRAYRRNKLSYSDFMKRIRSQMSLSEKRRRADYVIDNSGRLSETKKQVKKIWLTLTK